MASTLLKNTGLATGGVLIQGLARFGYTIVVGRALGAETLGQVSGLLALAVFVSLFWPTGAGVAASRFLPEGADSGQFGRPVVQFIVRDFLFSLPVLAAATFVGALLIGSDPAAALAAVAVAVAFSGYAFSRGAALGQGRFLLIAIADTVTAVLAIALLVLVLVQDVSWAILLPLAAGYAAFTVACWPRGGTPTLAHSREVTGFILVNSLAQLATGGALQIAMVAARAYDTPHNAGLFAAAFSLATPASLLALSVNQVLIPHVVRSVSRGDDDVRRGSVRILLIAVGGFGLLFGLLILAAPVLLSVLYGPAFTAAAPYMQVLLVGVFAYSVSLIPAAQLIGTGKDRLYAALAGVGLAATVVIVAVLGVWLGAWAAVLGYVAGSVLSAALIVRSGIRSRPAETPAPAATTRTA